MSRERARSIHTVVIGAGHAGLIASWYLREAGREHLLLDRRSSLGGGWQDRWEGFQLVTPNWTTSVPGFAYRGGDPDGYMPRDEIVAHFRAYAAAIGAPVELDTEVTRLRALEPAARAPRAARFGLETSHGPIEVRDVIVAAGPFQVPHIPAIAASFDPGILQLHSHHYRNPDALPPGGVLLVGSGQSGVQLAEELMAAGRSVTMAVGRCGRVPRRYRDRDVFWWLRALATRGAAFGLGLPRASELPDPRLRLACNPQASGHGTPHDIDLRRMAMAGLRLAGRLTAAEGRRAFFADDLAANLRFADAMFPERFRGLFDRFAELAGEDLPPGEFSLSDHEPAAVTELDLAAEGISTVLWTSGYRPAFGWLEPAVLDDLGLPRQVDGATSVPGLAFVGSPWLVDMGSANLIAVARDAETVVGRLLVEP